MFSFNKANPVVMGVEVLEGEIHINTPLCLLHKPEIEIGRVASIERDHKAVEKAVVGDQCAIKVVPQNAAQGNRVYGRHFHDNDTFASVITRASIDALKENFRDELQNDNSLKVLVVKLKQAFHVQ